MNEKPDKDLYDSRQLNETEKAQLRSMRFWRAFSLTTFFLTLPAALFVSLFAGKSGGMIAFFAFMLSCEGGQYGWIMKDCPRCHDRFFQSPRGWYNCWVTRCYHCQLSLSDTD